MLAIAASLMETSHHNTNTFYHLVLTLNDTENRYSQGLER